MLGLHNSFRYGTNVVVLKKAGLCSDMFKQSVLIFTFNLNPR